MYAHFNKLNYFCTECIYSPNAYRMNARSFIKELERIRPRAILDIVRSGEQFKLRANVAEQILSKCVKCGYITSQKYCKACLLLYGLNNDDPTVGIARVRFFEIIWVIFYEIPIRRVGRQNANKEVNDKMPIKSIGHNAYKGGNRQNAHKED